MYQFKVDLIRFSQGDPGTFGRLYINSSPFCYTAEPPERENRQGLSCIPVGDYICVIRKSPKYGIIFHVTDVEGRSYILIHSGNYAGDTEKKFKSHTKGCILLGQRRGTLGDQMAVLISKKTIRHFMEFVGKEPFKLRISRSGVI